MEGGRQQGPATLGGKNVRQTPPGFHMWRLRVLNCVALQKKPTLLRTLSDKFKTGTVAAYAVSLVRYRTNIDPQRARPRPSPQRRPPSTASFLICRSGTATTATSSSRVYTYALRKHSHSTGLAILVAPSLLSETKSSHVALLSSRRTCSRTKAVSVNLVHFYCSIPLDAVRSRDDDVRSRHAQARCGRVRQGACAVPAIFELCFK